MQAMLSMVVCCCHYDLSMQYDFAGKLELTDLLHSEIVRRGLRGPKFSPTSPASSHRTGPTAHGLLAESELGLLGWAHAGLDRNLGIGIGCWTSGLLAGFYYKHTCGQWSFRLDLTHGYLPPQIDFGPGFWRHSSIPGRQGESWKLSDIGDFAT